jgi:hypothetical protein
MHMISFQEEGRTEPDVLAAVMTQLSLKVGLRRWGEKSKEALRGSSCNLVTWFPPLLWNDLTETQETTILESHMFLKE